MHIRTLACNDYLIWSGYIALLLCIVISFVLLIFDTKAVGLRVANYRSTLFKEIERMITARKKLTDSMFVRVAGKILNFIQP